MSQILKAKNRILNRNKLSTNQNNTPQQVIQTNRLQQSPYRTIVERNPYTISTQKPYQSSRMTDPHQQSHQAISPNISYNKKFNISSISMKFVKNQQEQENQVDQFLNTNNKNITPNKEEPKRNSEPYDNIKLNLKTLKKDSKDSSQYNNAFEIRNQQQNQKLKRQASPQFQHTERINPIRHFQPYNLNTLSESNSQSSLRKLSKQKPRRISMQSHILEGRQSRYNEDLQKKSQIKSSYLQKRQSIMNQSPINKIRKKVHSSQFNLLIAKQDVLRAQSPYKPKQCLKQYTEQFIKSVFERQQGNRFNPLNKYFVDKDFPPQLTIFFPKKSLYTFEPSLSFEKINKCYQNLDLQTTLIRNAEPTLINPGRYTNPFLYSAMRILAQDPKKVLSLFQNQKPNQQGIYYVKICKDGTWRYIIVDDFVPVKSVTFDNKKSNCQFLGINNTDESGVVEIWPMLIQKALAKVYGTYNDLFLSRRDGICPLLRALTGYPVSKYDLIKDVRSYLVITDSALKKGHIILLEQILPEFQYLANSKNISASQSYQVLQIQKNFFVLRNLNDIDLVTKLTFDQVMMFSSLLIFRKQQNFNYISQKLRHKRGFYSTVKIIAQSNTTCYFDIWQNNPAYYKNHLQNRISYQVSPFKLIIQPTFIDPSVSQFDSVPQQQTIVESGKQILLKKGQYLLSIHLCQKMKQMDYTLSYYGEKDITIERVKNSHQKWNQRCCE